ncbi:hypothetical protein HNY73_007447 [Argiope bruennichi]|uniref:Uncharacterized protein n=1 Tax=Argiope bruennichi TaxID=94029 RepID=A0A8T0FDZ6_ARGBR|nr:hypothetical protein HNY73_007447 [Argiope bruennichi]
MERNGLETGGLSNETHAAFKVTTNAITEIAVYYKEKFGLDFILPGKFQTDNLESRFGLYRQISGGNDHICIRQLFETEKKIRIRSLLKLGTSSKTFGQVLITNNDLPDFGDVDEESVVLSFWPNIQVNVRI